ncbi:esterase-like activity of phytase family protein [Pseudovibrio exalbescens]|uniref:esterase-like activity of phytase family protein n=1 Tax=Pseudovibrio exalbescens TaxID=197461 RepID=UPI002366305D|nr:esterase-like activity of phytase family protein [Pseudovibrio exalbescens]MDD7909340.1 esterase-like activity of phytase family protein [Pseudovibrio exalbescens]
MKLSRRAFLTGVGAGITSHALPWLSSPARAAATFQSIPIRYKPLTRFRISDGELRRFGPLLFLGGLQLWAQERHFGGISGAVPAPDGSAFTTITDAGYWVRFNLRQDVDGRPLSVFDGAIAPMVDDKGRPLPGSRRADTEALTLDTSVTPAQLIASYEGRGGLFSYPAPIEEVPPRASSLPVPAPVHQLGGNKGLEAIAAGPANSTFSGKLIAIAERGRSLADNRPGFIISANGQAKDFEIVRHGNFDVTDAAFLPSGDLLILERLFNLREGLQMRLRHISASQLKPGARISGTILYTADFGYQIDNMEVLTVHQRADGATILTLMSDDNRNLLQRTLLLRFRLDL